MTALKLTTLALFATLALAGCGKVGDLERPRPLGAPPPAQDANAPSKPKSPEEKADPATSTGTISQSPLPNAPQDPFGRPNSSAR